MIDSDYTEVLSRLQRRLAALDEERGHVQAAMVALGHLVRTTVSDASATVPEPPRAASVSLAGMTMPQAVAEYFATVGNAGVTIRQVIDGLRAGGYQVGGKNLRGHVYNTLFRLSQNNGPYKHLPDGRWAVREFEMGKAQREIFAESA